MLLYLIVCAAPPASRVQELVALAQAEKWEVAVTATPDALPFMDEANLRQLTGYPVRSGWRRPGEPAAVPEADAIVVAPATFNTINKWVTGIADTVAVGTLCECLGSCPIVVAPNVNPMLSRHPAFGANLGRLEEWGARVLFDPAAPRESRMASWRDIMDALAQVNPNHLSDGGLQPPGPRS